MTLRAGREAVHTGSIPVVASGNRLYIRLAEGLRADGPTERFACDMLVTGISAMVTARLAAGGVEGLRALREPLTNLVQGALTREGGRQPR